MKHSELGPTYLTLLEAVKQTGLSEAEVVLHSEEFGCTVQEFLGVSRYVKTLWLTQLLPGLV